VGLWAIPTYRPTYRRQVRNAHERQNGILTKALCVVGHSMYGEAYAPYTHDTRFYAYALVTGTMSK
jgi:hypothetical protein